MSVLVLLCGVQGSGKSTFARNLSERLDVTTVATDAIRHELTGEYGGFIPTQTPLVMKLAKAQVRAALEVEAPRKIVLYDATNATPKARRPFITLARQARACVAACFFKVPLHVAMQRVERRTEQAPVPLKALRQTHGHFVAPSATEGFDWVFCGSETTIDECVRNLEAIGQR